MLPMYQIATARMAPVHVSPRVTIGIVLVKKLVLTIRIDSAVGDIHPVSGRAKVVSRALRVGRRLGNSIGNALHGALNGWIC